MKYSPQIWNQLKNLTAQELIHALKRDGAIRDVTRGAEQTFRYPDGRRISIHLHPKKHMDLSY